MKFFKERKDDVGFNSKRVKIKILVVLLVVVCVFTIIFFVKCTDQEIETTVSTVVDVFDVVVNESTTQVSEESNIELTTKPNFESNTESNTENLSNQNSNLESKVEGELQIHFIDVGQADATLFVHDDEVMLFDAATSSRGDELVEYIKNLGIDYIDVLVLTHPHNDHMGGSAEVLNNIEVGMIYGPNIFDISSLDNLKWYEDMINAVDMIDSKKNEGIPEDKHTTIWNLPQNEDGEFAKFNIGQAFVEFLAPLEDHYSDHNDYSICAKISFGEIDILLTGDATKDVEKALIAEGYDLDVEVFQASHHGSDTGNSREFLEAISPENIIISCGMKNRYDHPIKSVVDLYKEMKIPVYRTDESGDIIMITDGSTYSFNTKPGSYTSGEEYKKGE